MHHLNQQLPACMQSRQQSLMLFGNTHWPKYTRSQPEFKIYHDWGLLEAKQM